MASKRYLGKTLPDKFKQPQTRLVPNPKIKPIESLDPKWITWLMKQFDGINDTDQLAELSDFFETLYQAGCENERLPGMIDETIWTGSVQHEKIRCGKAGCKCTTGEMHGPYWYHYPIRNS